MQAQTQSEGVRLRAFGYVRVSTEDQASHVISIDSQIRKIQSYCEIQDFDLLEVVEEPGASGRNDRRPKLNAMLDRATSAAGPYDVIVVFSLSPFCRDVVTQHVSFKRLKAARTSTMPMNAQSTPEEQCMKMRWPAFSMEDVCRLAMNLSQSRISVTKRNVS